jgi:hypothetical protein
MVSKTQKIIFLYPPKTASNSLRYTLNENGFIEDSQNDTYLTPKLHLKLDEIMVAYDIESLDGYKVIQVTRNPYDRMISGYYHQIRIFNRPDFESISSISGYTFDKILRHLNSTINSKNFIDDFYGNSSHHINYVIDNKKSWGGIRFYHTQSSWKNVDCDFYHFKLEDLSKDIKPLSDLINLPLSPLHQINPNPRKVDYETHKTPQNKLIIQNLFSEDFDTFGYEK